MNNCRVVTLPRKGILILQKDYRTNHKNRVLANGVIQKVLRDNGIKTALSNYELSLVLDEALTNAMEHGHNWQEEKEFSIELRKGNYIIFLYLHDQGEGFDASKVPSMLKKKFKKSSRGRGIYIMSHYCKMLWNAKGNELVLCIRMRK